MFTDLLDRALRSRVVAVATAPHGVERYLDRGRATVVDVVPEAPDVVTLVLRPGRGWTAGTAGQHVRLGVEVDGRRLTRSFSLSSSQHRADGLVTVTVKAHPDGVVSRHLVDHAGPGTVVSLSAPTGDFTLPERRPDRLLLVSGGSGITPVMALLRTLVDEGRADPVTFVHYARTAADVVYADELAALERTHPWLDLRLVLTREGGTRFRPEHLDLDPATVETYACGPVGLVDAVLAHWDERGATERLHVERFTLAPVPTVGDDATGGEVRFATSGRTVADDGTTLLAQAEAAGLAPASGCRMGVCHTCTRPKLAGVVRDLRTGTLSGPGEEPVQICVSRPVGDVVVDL